MHVCVFVCMIVRPGVMRDLWLRVDLGSVAGGVFCLCVCVICLYEYVRGFSIMR